MAVNPIKDLAAPGQVIYHGFDFGQLMKVMVDCKVDYDQADRARRFNTYTLKVHSFVYASSEANEAAAMLNARQLLTEPGYNLDVTGQGFGDIKVRNDGTPNTAAAGGGSDLMWGPKPRLVHFEQVGASLTWELIWECEFCLSECPSAGSTLRNTMTNVNWQAVYSLDASGLCTRTIAGYIEVPQWRAANRNALAHAFRSKFAVTVPLGFRRERSDWADTPDRSRINFTIIDAEIPSPNAFPPGIVNASMPVEISNQNAMDFTNWTMSIGGFYETAPGWPTDHAWKKWYAAMAHIVQAFQARLNAPSELLLPQFLRIGIDKYSRRSRFQLVANMACEVHRLLAASGIWEPVPESNWALWRTSMVNQWGPFGVSSLTPQLNQDAIVDLCDPISGIAISDAQRLVQDPRPAIQPIFNNRYRLTPQRSYIHYQNKVRVRQNRNYLQHRPLYSRGNRTAPGSGNRSKSSPGDVDVKFQSTPGAGGVSDIIQTRGPDSFQVVMSGVAARVNFSPAVPNLVGFAGFDVREVDRDVDGPEHLLTTLDGMPILGARWQIKYSVDVPPGKQLTIDPQVTLGPGGTA